MSLSFDLLSTTTLQASNATDRAASTKEAQLPHLGEPEKADIALCTKESESIHFPILTIKRTTACKLGVSFQVGSMTFFWAFLSHLDEDDGASWIHGPNKSTRYASKDFYFFKVISNFPVKRSLDIRPPYESW